MRLSVMTWPEVESYLKQKRALVLPVGSTEQHGPIGLLGTDYLCADAIAQEVGKRLQTVVAPPLCYGMSSHHMAFPGSATVKPSVYQAVLAEILRSFYHHGFRQFHVVNGHGGNEPSLKAVFQELKHEGLEEAEFEFYSWWKLPEVTSLAESLFGDREGHHATPSEVSLTYFLEKIAPRTTPYPAPPTKMSWPMTSGEMRRTFPTGVMLSDSALARAEYGERFLKVAAEAIVTAIQTPKGIA